MAALLERTDALATLHRLLHEAASKGRVALVAGEAGIGKSSLLKAAAEAHGRCWWGACDALETPLPLAPWLDIAREQRPHFASRLAAPRPELFAAVLEELRAVSEPVLVVIEDAHWADDATLDLLKFIGRRIESTRAVLAISFRDDEVTASHPLRRLFGDLPAAAVSRVDLARLSAAAVETLARQASRPSDGLFATTRGNPFFVTEALREVGAAVPRTVQDLVLARYARLPGAAQAIVRLTALVPARIERWLLDARLSPSAGDIEACLASGLLQADAGSLHFRHELARVAVESSLAAPVAQALHASLLELLVARGHDVAAARLAHHAARAGDDSALRRFAPLAAQEAAARGSNREAAQHWRDALRCTADEPFAPQRLEWLAAYADTCRQLARFDDAIAAREELDQAFERNGDVRARAHSLSLAAQVHVLSARNARADEANRRALDLLEPLAPGPELATACSIEGALRMLDRDHDACLHWCARAVALARQFGQRERELMSMSIAATARLFTDYDAGVAAANEVLRLATAEGRDAVIVAMLTNLGSGAGETWRMADAGRWLREAFAFSTEHEMEANAQYTSAWLAIWDLRSGDWDSAAERASWVAERSGASSVSRLMATIALGSLRALRGDPGAEAALDTALALANRSQTLQRMAPVRAARAEVAWWRGDTAACDAEARDALPLAQQRRHRWFIGELAMWCWRAGRLGVDEALGLAPAEPFASEIAGRWREAAAAWQQLGCPLAQARALTGGDAASRQQALALLDALGAPPLADALRRQLRAEGVRGVARGARPSTRGHPCGLTGAEQRVLELMALELRNAEIAARLHRSVRTVDHHVAAVLAKLQVDSRTDAVRRAQREGWLDESAQSGQSSSPR